MTAKDKSAWLNEVQPFTLRIPRRMLFALIRASEKLGQGQSAFIRSKLDPILEAEMREVEKEYLTSK